MNRVIYWAAALVVIFTVIACAVPSVIDSSMNAAEAGDATALVQGCGSRPIVGYVYCRKRAGDVTSIDKLRFFGPKGALVEIFYPDGEPTLSLRIPDNQNSVVVFFKDLTKKDRFDTFDRGFWPFLITTTWKTENDVKRKTVQQGEIRLRVYNPRYTPLHESGDSDVWGWAWKHGGRVFKLSTAGRAYVGKH